MPRMLARVGVPTPPTSLDALNALDGLLRDGCDSEATRRAFIRLHNQRRREREERAGCDGYTTLAVRAAVTARARATAVRA